MKIDPSVRAAIELIEEELPNGTAIALRQYIYAQIAFDAKGTKEERRVYKIWKALCGLTGMRDTPIGEVVVGTRRSS